MNSINENHSALDSDLPCHQLAILGIKKTQNTNMAIQELNCLQINSQHSCTATSNLVQLTNQHRIDVAFIQEPYAIHNQLAGIHLGLTLMGMTG